MFKPLRTRRLLTASAVLLLLLAGTAALWGRQLVLALFGPPKVRMVEAYAERPDGPSFDHAALDALLARYVDAVGGVDYEGLATEQAQLDAYLAQIAAAPFDALGRDEKLALLINAYNAFTLRLILDHAPVDSIRDIPAAQRWDAERWDVGGRVWSLEQIEHEQIRPKFVEPRIHFALVCASVGCPPLRTEAYTADRLEQQLDLQARRVFRSGSQWYRPADDRSELAMSTLMSWYEGDFRQVAGSLPMYAAGYDLRVAERVAMGKEPHVSFMTYDWSLNRRGAMKP